MFQLKKLIDRVYLLTFDDHYDLCMHFIRYQEHYESPRYRGRKFELIDLLAWYTKKYGKGVKFTYPDDFIGFNIPSNVIYKVHEAGIEDPNRYDRFMLAIAEEITSTLDVHGGFYLIGVKTGDDKTLDHELAHGLYFTNADYHASMLKLISKLDPKIKKTIHARLAKACYHDAVYDDETQAYLATGLCKELSLKVIEKQRRPFIACFNKYKKALQKK
jgi:hypothetical protein